MSARHPKTPAPYPHTGVAGSGGARGPPGGRARPRPPGGGRPRASRGPYGRRPRRRHVQTPLAWRLVDRFGAWVREVGLLVLGVVGVLLWSVSLAGTALLVGGAP
jgi:hypothetical protein